MLKNCLDLAFPVETSHIPQYTQFYLLYEIILLFATYANLILL